MKWRALSRAGRDLIDRLIAEAKKPLVPPERIVEFIRALRAIHDFVTIPWLLNFLVADEKEVAEETSLALNELFSGLPPNLLPALEERIRRNYWGRPFPFPVLTPLNFARLYPGHDPVISFGLASCHSNGHVRERAVRKLDSKILSGREIPFLLLRLDDWVQPVRAAAEEAIGRRLTDSHRKAYLDCLPLIVRLKTRLRAGNSPALGKIEALLQKDLPALIEKALTTSDGPTQRAGFDFAWKIVATGGEPQKKLLIETMLAGKQPSVRLRAAMWLVNPATSPELRHSFLPKLLEDRFFAIRRMALGWCAMKELPEHSATLRAALLDPSGVVRSLAQYYLPKLEPIDLPAFYREATKRADGRVLPAALGGLGETGQASDAEMILPFLNLSRIALYKTALIALAKVCRSDHTEIFITALQTAQPGISRQARIILESRAATLDQDRLWMIFTETPYPHVRVQTLSLIRRLSKWQALPLLIKVVAQHQDALGAIASNYLRDWLTGYNRTHQVQPTKIETAQFQSAISEHRANLNPVFGRELQGLADSLG